MRSPLFRSVLCLGLFATLTAGAALTGGFSLSIERPSGAASQDAVLVVRPVGCHEPSQAKLTASAEGLVAGKRVSRPLRLEPLEAGVYGIRQQWTAEGRWAVTITGTYLGATRSALVMLGPGGAVAARAADDEDLPVRIVSGTFSESDIDAALASAARGEQRSSTDRSR